tara:strand:+ start:199 stop:387 length:189 start_codon:yes stop_codon:yes gene_type:complete
MSDGFDIDFEGIGMDPDQVQELLKKYKKVKKYQRSNLFAIKNLDGTEDIVSKMIEESREAGF